MYMSPLKSLSASTLRSKELGLTVSNVLCKSEIDELKMSLCINEDILWLEIAIGNAFDVM